MRDFSFSVTKDVLDLGVKIVTARIFDVLQVQPTKITEEVQDIFFIIQGNANTSSEYIERSAQQLIEWITLFCKGNGTILIPLVVE